MSCRITSTSPIKAVSSTRPSNVLIPVSSTSLTRTWFLRIYTKSQNCGLPSRLPLMPSGLYCLKVHQDCYFHSVDLSFYSCEFYCPKTLGYIRLSIGLMVMQYFFDLLGCELQSHFTVRFFVRHTKIPFGWFSPAHLCNLLFLIPSRQFIWITRKLRNIINYYKNLDGQVLWSKY